MSYRIAGIDVHKKMLAVVVADVEGNGEYQFERRQFFTTTEALRELAEWLNQQAVEEVVMESTAQYWRPVWGMLEQCWQPVREQRPGSVRRFRIWHRRNPTPGGAGANDFPMPAETSQATGGPGIDSELCAVPCPTVVADGHPAAESVDGAKVNCQINWRVCCKRHM